MIKSHSRRYQIGLLLAAFLLTNSCSCQPTVVEHEHEAGAFGGFIVSVGEDHYHAEIVIEQPRQIKIFMRGKKDSEVLDVEQQDLVGYVRKLDESVSQRIDFQAARQAGDAEGKTSLFIGELPEGIAFTQFVMSIPSITINNKRYRFQFVTPQSEHGPAMPTKVANEAERELYLQPGGGYTQADIVANGSQTVSQKYAKFQSAHDLFPKTGDPICPITQTKANPACSWIIGGKTYTFCCPPCIDEFVKLAKNEPGKIQPPEKYRKE